MTTPDRSQESGCAIGVDVGGSKIAAGLIAFPEGRVLARRWQPTRPDRGGAAVLSDVVNVTRSLQHEALELRVRPTSLGLGVAELIGVEGEVLSDATIHWMGVPVGKVLRAETGLLVTVEADVRAAARGEAQFGAGRDFASFLYVTVGTGISSSLVIHGTPYAGARGLTGTFASSRNSIPNNEGMLVSGPPLEQFAAGPALAARLAALRGGFSGGAPEVIELAAAGDEAAGMVVATAAQALGAAVGNLVNVLDPEAVIVGGGLGSREGIYREFFDSWLRSHIWSDIHRDVPLLSARLGDDAGFVGAAIAAFHR